MSNKLQCPQCGASSSIKVSDTEYHCAYCESNFKIGMSKEDLIASLLKKAESTTTYTPKLTTYDRDEVIAAAKKRGKTVGIIIVFVVLALIIGGVFAAVNLGSKKGGSAYWGTPSVSKFQAFAGSKGPVVWYLEEYSSHGLDSAKFTLKIVDPSNAATLKEMNYVPVMTWKEGFDSNEFIGDYNAFGDTCWITSERDALIARNIYTGEIIVDAQKLGQLYPKLVGGISKAKFSSGTTTFDITSSDGLEYVFAPKTKTLFTKDEFEKANDVITSVRTFFLVSEDMRPHLFKVVENTSPFATASKAYSHQLEGYDGTNFKGTFNLDVISVTKLNPSKVYFNGKVAMEDGNKAVILYQENTSKKSGLHIVCTNGEGKELWKLDQKDMGDFSDAYAKNNYSLNFVASKNKLYMYMQYPSIEVLEINMDSGKAGWNYKGEK